MDSITKDKEKKPVLPRQRGFHIPLITRSLLHDRRIKMGFTQDRLAEVLACEPKTIQNIENPRYERGIEEETFQKLCEVLKTTSGDVLPKDFGEPQDSLFQEKFLTLRQIDTLIGTFHQRMAAVSKQVLLSGVDCAYTVRSEHQILFDTLDRGVSVNILLPNPKSKLVNLPRFSQRSYQSLKHYRSEIASSLRILRELKLKFRKRLEVKILPFRLPLHFFITDPPNGIVKLEFYPIGIRKNIRPHLLVTTREQIWRKHFLQLWDDYWGAARALKL